MKDAFNTLWLATHGKPYGTAIRDQLGGRVYWIVVYFGEIPGERWRFEGSDVDTPAAAATLRSPL